MDGVRATDGGVLLDVWLKPNARKTAFIGFYDRALHVQVQAPAVENKANRALITFLALRLGCPRSRVTLVRGGKSRRKTLMARGVDQATAVARLAPEGAS
jgi:uncharacterized protein